MLTIKKKHLFTLFTIPILFTFSGCGQKNNKENQLVAANAETTSVHKKNHKLDSLPYDSWITYWDYELGLQAIKQESANLQSVSLFEIFFDEHGHLVHPTNFEKMKQQTKKIFSGNTYITIVNDILASNGKIKQKDTALLEESLTQAAKREELITNLVNLVVDNQADGLDLDFENIEKQGSSTLKESYPHFISELHLALSAANKQLRVFIEPGEDFTKFQSFPDLEFMIMCYNLYGPHSEQPGPKADRDFLEKLAQKAQVLPNKTFVLADGGFTWSAAGEVTTLSKSKIKKLINHQNAQRDSSAALSINYQEEQQDYEAWVGDNETLTQWSTWITHQIPDAKFGVWRLGN